MEIAVIGTGTMGAPMARHLLEAGHAVRAYNRTREKAEPLAEHGATVAGSAGEALDGAEVVVTMLLDAPATQAAVGDDLARVADGAVWWQAGTVGIEGDAQLAALAAEHGVGYVDAPVLGTKGPAEAGELLVLASGPDAALDRLDEVFAPTAKRVVRLGDAGAGTRLKLVVNHWLGVLVDGSAETVQLARALGVDPAAWLDAISGGPIDSGYAQLKGKAMIDADYTPSFALDNAAKDTRLIIEAARGAGLDLGLSPVILERIERASAAGHGADDMAAVVEA